MVEKSTQMRFRSLLTLFALLGLFTASAHQVDSVELEFLRPEGKWRLEGLLDIAYMLPESRGVQGAPPLFRKEVMNAPEQEHARIVQTAENTMRELLSLRYNGKVLDWDIRFPDFEARPLVLPPEAGEWALMRAVIDAEATGRESWRSPGGTTSSPNSSSSSRRANGLVF